MKRKPNRVRENGSTLAAPSQPKTAPPTAPARSKPKPAAKPTCPCFALFPGDGKEIGGVADDYVRITRREYATLRRAFGRDGIAFCTVKAGLETAMAITQGQGRATA